MTFNELLCISTFLIAVHVGPMYNSMICGRAKLRIMIMPSFLFFFVRLSCHSMYVRRERDESKEMTKNPFRVSRNEKQETKNEKQETKNGFILKNVESVSINFFDAPPPKRSVPCLARYIVHVLNIAPQKGKEGERHFLLIFDY